MRETFHDEFSFTIEDFCGAAGLTVNGAGKVDGKFLGRLQGSDSVLYGMEHVRQVR